MLLRLLTAGLFLLPSIRPLAQVAYWDEPETPPAIEVEVRKVILARPTPLSRIEDQRLAAKLQKKTVLLDRDGWTRELAEETEEYVRQAYQDKGYFLAEVSCSAARIGATARVRAYVFCNADAGQQYRLGAIRWKNVRAFPEERLVALMGMARGEIFVRAKITKGLEAVRRFYGSKGYINFTCFPGTKIDKFERTIDLEIDADEGRLFRWRDLHVVGMSERDEKLLQEGWRQQLRDKPVCWETRKKFFAEFFRPVHHGVQIADLMHVTLDESAGSVDLTLALWPNPSLLRKYSEFVGKLPHS